LVKRVIALQQLLDFHFLAQNFSKTPRW
jgi:hypothetical protein